MAQKISQMTEQTTARMTEAGTSDFLGGYTTTGGNANRKFSLSGLANYFLNKFKMTLGGSSQTVKSAIDALNSNVNKLKVAKFDVANISELETKLAEIATNYSNYDYTMVSFSLSAGGAYFIDGTGYEGLLYKNATGYLVLEAFNHNSTALPVLGRCANGTWVWDNLALKSNAFQTVRERDGGGAALCSEPGFYLIAVRHLTDNSAYCFCMSYKVSGIAPITSVIAYNGITVNAKNAGGTIAFLYKNKNHDADLAAYALRLPGFIGS